MTIRDLEESGISDPDWHREMLQVLLEAIPSSFLLVNKDMRVVLANKNFITRSLRPRENIIGERLDKVLPPAIIERIDITNLVQEVFATRTPIVGKRLTYRAPGIPIKTYYYSIFFVERPAFGENVLLLFEDVTEQVRLSEEVRRVERHLACVVESARDIVLSTDPYGNILTWNAEAERLTGFLASEVRGETVFKVFPINEHTAIKEVLKELKAARPVETRELGLLAKDGNILPMSWSFSHIADETRNIIGIVAVGRDLSERKALELRLLQSQKLTSLGVMAGGIAHEIRNPLAVCLSAAQFLKDANIDPKFREECVERIERGINRAASIIENLLKFARSSPTAEMTSTDLIQVLKDALLLVSNQAKVLKIAISTDFSHQEINVHGNANLLQQMFLNLFLNACNAMPSGGKLSVTTGVSDQRVRVSILDTGCGIPEKYLAKIFDPFFTTAPVGKGTGLGLSICYSIVQQHLGTLSVESAEGQGTRVLIQLPIL